ncbi:MAG: hypothetical protein MK078_04900, partial [Crocinitomicaceae bacterium]|nr:hypothetical protein [Crocinitomicaceae bacterium]
MGSITLFDWLIWSVYFVLIFIGMFIYRSTKQEDHYKYYIRGLLIKIFGGVAFALIYVYYYKFGDTFLYHRGAIVLSESLLSDPSDYFR